MFVCGLRGHRSRHRDLLWGLAMHQPHSIHREVPIWPPSNRSKCVAVRLTFLCEAAAFLPGSCGCIPVLGNRACRSKTAAGGECWTCFGRGAGCAQSPLLLTSRLLRPHLGCARWHTHGWCFAKQRPGPSLRQSVPLRRRCHTARRRVLLPLLIGGATVDSTFPRGCCHWHWSVQSHP